MNLQNITELSVEGCFCWELLESAGVDEPLEPFVGTELFWNSGAAQRLVTTDDINFSRFQR